MNKKKQFKRLANLNGVIEYYPKRFEWCKNEIIRMIKDMDDENIDRGDMRLVLNELISCLDINMEFYLHLENREELFGDDEGGVA